MSFGEDVAKKRAALERLRLFNWDRLGTEGETFFRHGTQAQIGQIIGGLAAGNCYLGSSYVRVEADWARAKLEFVRNLDLIPILEKALNRFDLTVPLSIPPRSTEVLDARELQWFMVGVLLARSPADSRKAALLMLHSRVRGHQCFPYELFMAACVAEDFNRARELARVLADIPLQQSLDGFAPAIIDRDQGAFDEAIQLRLEAFAARSRMRTFEEHGCTKLGNRLQLDSFGIAMCQIAMAQGLVARVESPYFPPRLMVPWNA